MGVTTSKRQTSILQMFSLYSPGDSYDEKFLSNYISINLKPAILRIQGVGDMMIMGGDYSMRIWMKPDVMAQYKLIPSDVTQVLAEQNIESATGSFGENSDETYQYTMKYKGRLITPEEFGEIVIRSSDNGEVLKLKEIADIEMGEESYAYHGAMNGHPGISCMIFQTAGSNATEVNNNIDTFLEEARKDLPKGVEMVQVMSSNDFLYASIHEVIKTLFEAIFFGNLNCICIFAGYPFYYYSVGGDHRVLDWYICFYVHSRIQYQPDYPVCFGVGDRYGGG